MRRLGLDEDELCRVLEVDALSLIGGELEHRSELSILLALSEEAAERVGEEVLRRWVRTSGPSGRPLDHLLARDFAAFEHDLEGLERRGFVIRGPGGGAAA